MWIGVTKRFRQFHSNIQLTNLQLEGGRVKQVGVMRVLHRAYWGEIKETLYGFPVGSWGKGTAIRPPNDVDIFVPLPSEVFRRFLNYQGNAQSALLQEVKGHLTTTYKQTDIRGDGQVVVVAYGAMMLEVVPVFFAGDDKWIMPDTHNGGSWKVVRPAAEIAAIDTADTLTNDNARRLIQIMKVWRNHCSVPLKSFLLEILVIEFLCKYEHRKQDFFYYDWFVRDFLGYIIRRKNGYIYAPNSDELVSLGDKWVSRAETAHRVAIAACEHEYDDYTALAGNEWQKLFGRLIPGLVL